MSPGSTLELNATDHLGNLDLKQWGDYTRTIITGGNVLGTFTNAPDVGDHLGHGVFLTDQGANGQGVTYNTNSVVVDVFQAAPGDTDGNRAIDGNDIVRILLAAKFGTGLYAEWPFPAA